jgi:hypothetical protein
MNSSTRISPTVAGLRFVINMATSLVAVVIDVDITRLAAIGIPSEHEPPLPIDADRVEAPEVASQSLEMVAGWDTQAKRSQTNESERESLEKHPSRK